MNYRQQVSDLEVLGIMRDWADECEIADYMMVTALASSDMRYAVQWLAHRDRVSRDASHIRGLKIMQDRADAGSAMAKQLLESKGQHAAHAAEPARLLKTNDEAIRPNRGTLEKRAWKGDQQT